MSDTEPSVRPSASEVMELDVMQKLQRCMHATFLAVNNKKKKTSAAMS